MSVQNPQAYPLFESVPAWLPFTPETGWGERMDLESYLIDHPASTYFVRVKGDSMEGAGIYTGDIVILDRARIAENGDIIIASLDGEVTLKRLEKQWGHIRLLPENPKYAPIIVDGPCEIMGVVVGLIRKYH